MDRDELKQRLISERENKVASLEAKIARKQKQIEEASAKEQEKIEILKLEIEAFKKIK